MDRSRHDNRSDQWRKRTGARRRRAIILASVPKRLVFVTVAAAAALITQFIVLHRGDMPDVNLSNGRSCDVEQRNVSAGAALVRPGIL